MKKIGILTFHFCDNYGAVLQCYALKTAINNFSGCQAEVINFNPNWKPGWFTENDLQAKQIERLNSYKEFTKSYLNINDNIIYDMSKEDPKKYDYYIVGSDQIWNPTFNFFNTTYFLDFLRDEAVKISYAASIGISTEDKRLDPELFMKYIPNFDFISIREQTHEAFIKQFTNKKVNTVLDPTLLIDKEKYEIITSKINKTPKNKYIFLYFLKHDSTSPLVLSFVNMLSRKYNLKVIHNFIDLPTNIFKNESESYYFKGPEDFLWYIKNAELVITNSFHGTIFSIIYQKPFYTYIVKNLSSRIYNLLGSLGLEDRIISGYKNLEDINLKIDYSKVHKNLLPYKNKSIQFLNEALDI